MKIGYYVTPLLKHQQFELDFGNFGTIALGRKAVIELIENLTAALEEHPAAQQSMHPTSGDVPPLVEFLSQPENYPTAEQGSHPPTCG